MQFVVKNAEFQGAQRYSFENDCMVRGDAWDAAVFGENFFKIILRFEDKIE